MKEEKRDGLVLKTPHGKSLPIFSLVRSLSPRARGRQSKAIFFLFSLGSVFDSYGRTQEYVVNLCSIGVSENPLETLASGLLFSFQCSCQFSSFCNSLWVLSWKLEERHIRPCWFALILTHKSYQLFFSNEKEKTIFGSDSVIFNNITYFFSSLL